MIGQLRLEPEAKEITAALQLLKRPSLLDVIVTTNAGYAPQVLAALRNTALTVVRCVGFKPVEDFEHFARQGAIGAVI